MREPGLAEVRRAQADGRWAGAYASQKTVAVPPDPAALDAHPAARTAFAALDRTGRYLVALPLLQALTPEARQVRLERAVHRPATGEGALAERTRRAGRGPGRREPRGQPQRHRARLPRGGAGPGDRECGRVRSRRSSPPSRPASP
ncbi:YdeI/OmpD-associated family protein [Streptomyces subrutilus]|uniref:YdeI/OmpD-associated family protein n=1 Tax=Streptomyces subrutilus TaxID=36818 RepID=UPI0009A01911|nr:YdeI/OmpD-associated family protein [Streptomyces subrutilus]